MENGKRKMVRKKTVPEFATGKFMSGIIESLGLLRAI